MSWGVCLLEGLLSSISTLSKPDPKLPWHPPVPIINNLVVAPFRTPEYKRGLFQHCTLNKNTLYYSVFSTYKRYIYRSKIHYMNRIKEVLDERGIKQVWLADQLGKSYNVVNGYVQNRNQPSLEVLFKIAEILNVEAKELIIERGK